MRKVEPRTVGISCLEWICIGTPSRILQWPVLLGRFAFFLDMSVSWSGCFQHLVSMVPAFRLCYASCKVGLIDRHSITYRGQWKSLHLKHLVQTRNFRGCLWQQRTAQKTALFNCCEVQYSILPWKLGGYIISHGHLSFLLCLLWAHSQLCVFKDADIFSVATLFYAL